MTRTGAPSTTAEVFGTRSALGTSSPRRLGRFGWAPSIAVAVAWFLSCRTPPPLPRSAETEDAPPPLSLARAAAVDAPEPTPPPPAELPPASPPEPAHQPGADQRELEARHGSKKALATLRGEASYYGKAFAGRKTASGEVFDPARFTAAHRTLPFGTVLRVTRVETKEAVYVRVNDRGPFGKKRRIIDLSEAAARELDMLRVGVCEVKVEVLLRGPAKKKKKRGRRGKKR